MLFLFLFIFLFSLLSSLSSLLSSYSPITHFLSPHTPHHWPPSYLPLVFHFPLPFCLHFFSQFCPIPSPPLTSPTLLFHPQFHLGRPPSQFFSPHSPRLPTRRPPLFSLVPPFSPHSSWLPTWPTPNFFFLSFSISFAPHLLLPHTTIRPPIFPSFYLFFFFISRETHLIIHDWLVVAGELPPTTPFPAVGDQLPFHPFFPTSDYYYYYYYYYYIFNFSWFDFDSDCCWNWVCVFLFVCRLMFGLF